MRAEEKLIKIAIADDHDGFLQELESFIRAKPGMETVGTASDGLEAIEMVKRCSPDIVIMDVSMPKMNGIMATKEICTKYQNVKVIGLSIHLDKQFIAGMLNAGASGYVLKESLHELVHRGIFEVMDGVNFVCNRVAGFILSSYVKDA